MNTSNQGKEFEKAVHHSCDKQGIFCYKIPDTYIPLQNLNGAYAPKMPSDFLMHWQGKLFFVECKTTQQKYMGFERTSDSKGMIHYSQWYQMKSISQKDPENVKCGFLLQFENQGDVKTYYLSLDNFLSFMDRSEKNSLNPLDVVQSGGIVVPSQMLRVHRAYDIKNILERVGN